MVKPKILFVFNPRAGKAKVKNKLCDIIDIFVKAGYEVTVYPTQAEGDAIQAVKDKREDYDLLVCSGGDGTLDEAVNGMIKCEKQIPIGYIPAGSTNDFARSLGIPKDMRKAAEMIVGGKDYACDIGVINEECFVYIAAFGIFTDVSYETSQNIKNVLGHMAYILEGMKRLSSIKSYRLKVKYWQKGDGEAAGKMNEVEIEDEFIFGMVTNSISVGGFRRITGKYVEMDDGEFEVTLIRKPSNPLDINAIMASLLSRRINTDHMYCFKTSRITFESEKEIPWTTDGEFGGNHRVVDIVNWKQAVRMRVGEDKVAEIPT
ncbi:MAG: YegS/Rv2252/BmrU family lipid kinase [Kineothrix sp.]|nr:YegS/Rv2252/BmrU family lipid kinase [Kineothrix sp.]